MPRPDRARLLVDWGRPGGRRCGWCGGHVPAFTEAGHGRGRVFCEGCFRSREHRAAALWVLGRARTLPLTGAA